MFTQQEHQAFRLEFPQLEERHPNGKRLCYLDNASTSLKPNHVLNCFQKHMRQEVSNVHRGIHSLSQLATDKYETTRAQLATWLGAASPSEVIFTRGTTYGLNLLAHGLARSYLQAGDTVLLTEMEHHSNFVSWQHHLEKKDVKIEYIPLNDQGGLDFDLSMLHDKVKVLSIVHQSNVSGTVNDLAPLLQACRERGIFTVVDAAQSVSHLDLRQVDADALVFSGHKWCAAGAGVLYLKANKQACVAPLEGGGSMIETVGKEGSTFAPPPTCYEAGTPPIAEIFSLGDALHFFGQHDFKHLCDWERSLYQYACDQLEKVPGVKIVSKETPRSAVVSFILEGVHPHDIGSILDEEGVCVRAGHHCCQPFMEAMGLTATTRASFLWYNNEEDVDQLVRGILKVKEIFHV